MPQKNYNASQKLQKYAEKAQYWSVNVPGSKEYQSRVDADKSKAFLIQSQNSVARNFGQNVGAAAPFFQVFKPLIFGAVILLLIAGPGIMGISNIAFNTPIWVWVGGLFLIILLFKLGIFGKR